MAVETTVRGVESWWGEYGADEWSDAQYLFVLAKINARISAEATRISRQQGRGDGGGGQPRSRSSGSRRRGRGGR